MSHLVQISTKVRDELAIAGACRRLGLAMPRPGTATLFSGECTGLLLQLPGWNYPAVLDLATGTIAYDNFNGAWGEQEHLDRFLQAYAVEKAKLEARKKNFAVAETVLGDGSIQLSIREGG